MNKATLLQSGIDAFNRRYFFEAHDAFEEIWMSERGEAVQFYQGLVQISTGFYHLQMKNMKGAKSQLNKGLQKLNNYKPLYENILLDSLLFEIQHCIEQLNTVSLPKIEQKIRYKE